MVGRKAELERLQELVGRAARRQQPEVALISAEAGVGKTRLLKELVGPVSRGTIVLAGHADERDMDRPFSLVREALQGAIEGWEEIPTAVEQYAHPLAHLLSPLLPYREHPADAHEHGPDQLLRAGVALIRHLAGGGPAIIAFDDLHWADAESVELFRRLANASNLPALIVGTFRPEEYRPSHPLAATLEAVTRQHDVIEIPLACLSQAQLRAFLTSVRGAPVPDGVVTALHDRTQGNPFFVEELIAAARQQAVDPDAIWVDHDALLHVSLPWTAAEAVRRRLSDLPEGDRRTAEAAAVLGLRFGFALLGQVLEVNESELLPACRRLVTAGMFVEQAADTFVFRHALTREAISSSLLSLERRRIHERALHALEQSDESCHTDLARHALGAEDAAKAKRYVELAAKEAMRDGAPRQALQFAERGLVGAPRSLQLHAIAARAAADVGQLDVAAVHAACWADSAVKASDGAQQCYAHCHEAWLHWSRGDTSGAWSSVDAALSAANTVPDEPAALARALAVKAQIHLILGQAREAIRWADMAIETSERAHARDIRAHALVTKGTALCDTLADKVDSAVIQDARALLDEGRGEAEAIGDVETLTRALHNMLLPGQGLTTPTEARRLAEEARDIADRYGLERFASKIAGCEAYAALAEGDSPRVRTALERCKQSASVPMDRVWNATLEATLLIEAGDTVGAEKMLAQYWPAVEQIEDMQARMDFAVAEVSLAAATHNPELAEAALRRASASVGEVSLLAALVWWDVAILAVDAGVDPDIVTAALREANPPRTRRQAGMVHHLQGVLLAAAGRTDEAVTNLRLAAGETGRWRPALMVADANLRLAHLLMSQGDDDGARRHAQRALTLLERWPGRRREAADRMLNELRVRRQPGQLLTPREREVLELIAGGLSNREIAERLVITERTAATHVSNILRKTGLRSRTQAATWGVEAGLARAGQGRVTP